MPQTINGISSSVEAGINRINTSTTFSDSPNVDAFGRLRVSQNHILFSGATIFDKQPLLFDEVLVLGGTSVFDSNDSSVLLSVPTTNGARVTRQTKNYWIYRAAQSHLVQMTFNHGSPVANISKRIGYFDDQDGVFLEITGSGPSVVIRSSSSGSIVNNVIPQSSWNLDKLDGSGHSGFTLDLSKAQILHIDLQWLGVGRVRIGFNINGIFVCVHEFLHSNLTNTTYMKRASLPVRYEIVNTGTSVGGSLKSICAGVAREGGDEEHGMPSSIATPLVNPPTATTTPRTVLSIRLRDSHIRGFLKPTVCEVANLETDNVKYQVVLNPTVSGTFTTWSGTGQGAQYALDQLPYVPNTGQIFETGIAIGGNNSRSVSFSEIETTVGVAATVSGVSDILSVIVESGTGTQDVFASLSWNGFY